MPIIELQSLDDPRVADYLAVSDPDLLRRRQQFVAEGRLVVDRLLASTRYRIRSLLLSQAAWQAFQHTHSDLPDLPIYVCASASFKRLAGLNLHRGCLALAERPAPESVDAVLQGARLVVVLESIGNPDNVGGIFRNAAAFGVDAVLLAPGCADPLYRKSIRTSMAAVLEVPYAVVDVWPADLDRLRERQFLLAAFTPAPDAATLHDFAADVGHRRLALLFGAEGAGLSPATIARTDARIRIPITDRVDSLNVAVACGIALSALRPNRAELAR